MVALHPAHASPPTGNLCHGCYNLLPVKGAVSRCGRQRIRCTMGGLSGHLRASGKALVLPSIPWGGEDSPRGWSSVATLRWVPSLLQSTCTRTGCKASRAAAIRATCMLFLESMSCSPGIAEQRDKLSLSMSNCFSDRAVLQALRIAW